MFRFLHLADLHLGWMPKHLGAKNAERKQRRDTLLKRAVDFALEEKLDLVVIAGDLFETHAPDSGLVQSVLAELRRLTAAGVKLITTPGNHDEITYAESVYQKYQEEWPGVLVTNPLLEQLAPLDVAGESVHLYSLAYTGGITPAREPLSDFIRSSEPGFHLAVFHGTVGGGDERSLPLSREALSRAGYDYVALGHIHKPAVMTLGKTPTVYPGCMEGKGFDDPGVPYWTVVKVEGGSAVPEEVATEVQPIRVLELDLTPLDSFEEVTERVAAQADSDKLLRVRLAGSLHFSLDPDELSRRFKRDFYHFEVRDESDAIDDELLASWAAQPTIQGAFVRRMREKLGEADSLEAKRKLTRALRYGVRALRSAA